MPTRSIAVVPLLLFLTSCGGQESRPTEAARTRTLTIGAYTTPREAYDQDVFPAFQAWWKQKTGEDVVFETSWQGSGAQSRAIVGGFEADIAALSLEADVTRIAESGLITRDWKAGPTGGMVSSSIAVLAVRQGNPKGVKDWNDLTRADLEVLTPNVRTSGGAMWNVAAVYGAATRGHVPGVPAGDEAAAERLLSGILGRVTIMDKGARESIVTYEKGVGDVAITYENEVLSGRLTGQTYEYVVPASTILIVNPIAVVDTYAEQHGVKDLADAFVAFALGPDSQRAFAKHGYRPVDPAVLAETAARFPAVTDLFTVQDLGGWPTIIATLFDQGMVYDRALVATGTSSPSPAAP